MTQSGHALLHRAAVRILAEWMRTQGCAHAVQASERESYGRFVDLVCLDTEPSLKVKVKADPYFGSDPSLVVDRSKPFYRQSGDTFAFEAVADASTRAQGWALTSDADQLWYYRLAIASPEDEVAALLAEPDEVFFGELAVEADHLTELPMRGLSEWFEANLDAYPPRPVSAAGVASWCRLVPETDLRAGVANVRSIGPVFASLHP